MTNEQILKKAISKAEKNGYVPKIQYKFNPVGYLNNIIFDLSFAKAFWKKCECDSCQENNSRFDSDGYYERRYGGEEQFHLQQMVISKDPMKYIEKFLKK